jgi:hypothetical protein
VRKRENDSARRLEREKGGSARRHKEDETLIDYTDGSKSSVIVREGKNAKQEYHFNDRVGSVRDWRSPDAGDRVRGVVVVCACHPGGGYG